MTPFLRTVFDRRQTKVLLVLNFCVLIPHLVCAQTMVDQTTGVFHPFVSFSTMYDSNVLGLPDKEAAQALTGSDKMSDVSKTLQAGISLNEQISRQLLTATISASKTEYNQFKELNNDGKNLVANWKWQLGNYWSGNLGTSYVKSLTPFTDFHALELNTRTQEQNYLDAAWLFHPSWRVTGRVSSYSVKYDLVSQQPNNHSEDSGQVGLDYLASTDSTIGIVAKHIRGYVPFMQIYGPVGIESDYTQDELKAKIDWHVSGKSRLQFLGGEVRRKHDVLTERDFTGTNSRLIFDWFCTGKLKITSAIWKEIGIYDDLSTSYSINHGVSIAPTWNISAKTAVVGNLQYVHRDFTQSAVLTLPSSGDLKDNLRAASLSLNYAPIPSVLLQSSIFYNAKVSGDASNDYARRGLSFSMQYQY
jgi:exopolysaccharide biosynthesis operon protein EpsL